jgi:hypothetical protein
MLPTDLTKLALEGLLLCPVALYFPSFQRPDPAEPLLVSCLSCHSYWNQQQLLLLQSFSADRRVYQLSAQAPLTVLFIKPSSTFDSIHVVVRR